MGPLAIKVEWVPISATFPLSKTTISSQFWMVDNLCATRILVLPIIMHSNASCTAFTERLSSALVALSSNKIVGFLSMARAIAIHCFCLPDSCNPLSPTRCLPRPFAFWWNHEHWRPSRPPWSLLRLRHYKKICIYWL